MEELAKVLVAVLAGTGGGVVASLVAELVTAAADVGDVIAEDVVPPELLTSQGFGGDGIMYFVGPKRKETVVKRGRCVFFTCILSVSARKMIRSDLKLFPLTYVRIVCSTVYSFDQISWGQKTLYCF